MNSIETRILELDFDGSNFERKIRSTMQTLGEFETALEMRSATDGFVGVEKAIENFSFTPLERGIEDVSEKFTLMGESASEQFGYIETSSDDVDFANMMHAIDETTYDFDRMGDAALDQFGYIDAADNNVDLESLRSAIDSINDRFSLMGIAASSAMQTIIEKAMSAGSSLLHSLGEPIIGGGMKRAQSIANAEFTLQGLIDSQKEVDAVLKDAMDSVDGTAYAYDAAASAASQFAASGMRSGPQLQKTLKGIAGVAATTNSSYEDMSRIFLTVSGNGRLMGDQLIQLSSHGLPVAANLTTAFNDVLKGSSKLSAGTQKNIKAAVQFGIDNIKDFQGTLKHVSEKDIRDLVSKGQISFDIFSDVLATTFGDHAKDANKTFQGSMANIRSALARTGALFLTDLVAQETPIVDMFNNIRVAVNMFNGIIEPTSKKWVELVFALSKGVSEFVKGFFGYEKVFKKGDKAMKVMNPGLAAFKDLIGGITDILKTIGDAFDRVFGVKGMDVYKVAYQMGEAFHNFTRSIRLTEDQLEILGAIFEVIFRVIKLLGSGLAGVMKILSVVVQFLAKPLWVIGAFVRDFVQLASGLGDVLKMLNPFPIFFGVFAKASEKASSAISGFLDKLRGFINSVADLSFFHNVADGVVSGLNDMKQSFTDFFGGTSGTGGGGGSGSGGITDPSFWDKLTEKIKPGLEKLKQDLSQMGTDIWTFLSDIDLSFIVDGIKKALEPIGNAIHKIVENSDLGDVAAIISTITFGGLASHLSQASDQIASSGEELTTAVQTFLAPVTDILKEVKGIGDTFKGLGSNIGEGMSSFADGFGEVTVSLDKAKTVDSVSLLGIAASVAMLAYAFEKISNVPTDKIVQSLTTIAVMLGILVGAFRLMALAAKSVEGFKGIFAAGGAVIMMSIALNFMADALTKLSTLNVDQILLGLLGLGGAMMILYVAVELLSSVQGSIIPTAFGILILAGAMKLLSDVLIKLGQLDPMQIGVGLIGLGGALLMMAGVMVMLMAAIDAFTKTVNPVQLLSVTVGIMGIAAAMWLLCNSMLLVKDMEWEEIAKGLAVVGGLLFSIGVFESFTNPAKILGLGVSVAGLAIGLKRMVEVFHDINAFNPDQLIVAVSTIFGVLASLAVSSTIVQPAQLGTLVVGIVLVSYAMQQLMPVVDQLAKLPVAQAITAAGFIGVLLLTMGAASRLAKGPQSSLGLSVMALALVPLVDALTQLAACPVDQVIGAIGGLAVVIGIMAGASIALEGALPGMIGLAGVFLAMGVACMAAGIGIRMMASAFTALVNALVENGNTLIPFMMELASNLPYLAQQMGKSIVAFIHGIAESATELTSSIVQIGTAAMDAMRTLIPDMANLVVEFIVGIAETIAENGPRLAEAFLEFIGGMLTAVSENIETIVSAGIQCVVGFINGIASGLPDIIQAAFNLVISFMNGLADAVRGNHEALFEAAWNLITAVVEAIIDGVQSIAGAAGDLIDGFFEGLGMDNPIDQMLAFGGDLVDGFVNGIGDAIGGAIEAAKGFFSDIANGICDFLGINPPSTLFAGYGNDTAQGWIDGFTGRQSDAENAATNFANATTSAFSNTKGGQEAGKSVMGDVITGLNAYSRDFSKTGSNEARMYSSGVSGGRGNARNAGSNLASGGVSGAGSKSSNFKNAGSTSGSNYTSGISSKNSSARTAGSSLASEGKSGAGSISWVSTGENAGEGYRLGILNKTRSVSNQAADMVRKAMASAKDAQKSQSPSKLFRKLGEYAGEGYELGIIDYIPKVAEASKTMAVTAIDTANHAISTMSFMDEMESEPVITPVVDMSNIVRSKREIDDIFSTTSLMASMSAQGIGTSTQLNPFGYSTSTDMRRINGDTNMNVNLNYDAGADANQMARDLARNLKRHQLARGYA